MIGVTVGLPLVNSSKITKRNTIIIVRHKRIIPIGSSAFQFTIAAASKALVNPK